MYIQNKKTDIFEVLYSKIAKTAIVFSLEKQEKKMEVFEILNIFSKEVMH